MRLRSLHDSSSSAASGCQSITTSPSVLFSFTALPALFLEKKRTQMRRKPLDSGLFQQLCESRYLMRTILTLEGALLMMVEAFW